MVIYPLGNNHRDSLRYVMIDSADYGKIVANDSTIQYTPKLNFYGTDTFILVRLDSAHVDSIITIVNVIPVNDRPKFIQKIPKLFLQEDDRVEIDFNLLNALVNDPDNDHRELIWNVESGQNIKIIRDDSKTYIVPLLDWNGEDSLSVIVSDGVLSDTANMKIKVEPVNDPPRFAKRPPALIFNEDSEASVTISSWFDLAEDPDNGNADLEWNVLRGHTIFADRMGEEFIFSSAPDWYGSDSLKLIVSDGDFNDTTRFVIDVIPVNDSPRFLADSLVLSYDEDDTLVFDLNDWRKNIYDSESATDSLALIILPGKNIHILQDGETIMFFSPDNWNGTDTLNVIVSDGILADTSHVYIEVRALNDPPKFTDEIPPIEVIEDKPFSADIRDWYKLISDPDNLADDLIWEIISGHSIQVVKEENIVQFALPKDWNGADSLLVMISDGEYFDAATLVIHVEAVNDPPEFMEVLPEIELREDTVLKLPYSSLFGFVNDVDMPVQNLVWSFSQGRNITSALRDSSVEFRPKLNWSGTDTISVFVSDGELSDTSAFTIKVQAINDPPVLAENIVPPEFDEDDEIDISIEYWYDKVSDPDNVISELQFSLSEGEFIRVEKNDSYFKLSSEKNWFGKDSIILEVYDGEFRDSTVIIISVNPVNDPPVFAKRLDEITFMEDEEYLFSTNLWRDNILDIDNNVEELSLQIMGGKVVTYLQNDSAIAFLSPQDWYGSELLTAIISDGFLSDTTNFTIRVVPVNDPPVFIGVIDTLLFNEDERLLINLDNWFTYVTDPDNNHKQLTWKFAHSPEVSITLSDGVIECSAQKNWNGFQTITAYISDGEFSDSAIVYVQVSAINDPPVFSTPPTPLWTKEDESVSVRLSEFYRFVDDPDDDVKDLSWEIESGPYVETMQSDSVVLFTPPLNWNGTDTIRLIASDLEYKDKALLIITVEPVNDPPTISDRLPECHFDEDEQIEILRTDWFNYVTDIDNTDEEIDFCVLDGNFTSSTTSGDGFIFRSEADWNGKDTVSLIVCDGEYSDTSQVFITVNPINDAPIIEVLLPDIKYDEDHEQLLIFSEWYAHVTDVDNTDHELSWEIVNGEVIEVALSQLSGILISPQNWFGYDTITVIVNDGEYFDTTFVPIEIYPVNDPPDLSEMIPDTAFYEDGYLCIPDSRWTPYVTDPDHPFQTLRWRITGTQSLSASGGERSIDFHAPRNWFGIDRAMLIVSDGLLSDTSYFRIRVLPVNDPPKLNKIPKIVLNEDSEYFIDLDTYVSDNDDKKSSLIWSTYLNEPSVETKVVTNRWFYLPGRYRSSSPLDRTDSRKQNGSKLEIVINNKTRKAAIIPHPNYYGDNIQYILKVKDPKDASDIATLNISVLPVNDPPRLEQIPEITFNEDETFSDSLSLWFPFVSDVDHPDSILNWNVRSGDRVSSKIKDGFVFLNGHPNWFGKDTLSLYVGDGEYLDTSALNINVLPVNDPPEPFELIGHIVGDSVNLTFQWYPSADIDGDTLAYAFHLKSEKLDTAITNIRGKHSLMFNGRGVLETGAFYEWYIEATDGVDFTRCNNPLKFYLQHLPGNFSLSQNYPNPFNKSTTVPFDVAEIGRVKIMVYDMHGKEIVRLVDEWHRPGHYEVIWDGKDRHSRDMATGVYLITMVTEDFSQVRKLMLIK
ncbi:MAG: tandem-95 repeat protein [Candidatus Marinimicrobia bacterium]|nr:tandem-95 repeat protein [Candidatus Neomarinimicrobiota bacterium]